MGKIVEEIIEDKFSLKSAKQYELSILIGVDSLSYAVVDSQQELLVLKKYLLDAPAEPTIPAFQHFFLNDPLLGASYLNTKIGVVHPVFSLVPERLFNREEQAAYLDQLSPIQTGDDLRNAPLESIESQLVYTIPEAWSQWLKTSFPNAKVFHQQAGLIEACANIASTRKGFQLFVNVRQGVVQVLLFEKNWLQFSNQFSYQTSTDFVYYVLMVVKQYQVPISSLITFISGTLIEGSEIYNLLYRYLPEIRRVPVVGLYQFGPIMEAKRIKHQYLDLFAMLYC